MAQKGKPVGFVSYNKPKFYEGFVHFLTVDEKERGKGYGLKLLKYAVDDLARTGASLIRLVTRVENYPAQKIYKTLGFKEIKRDERFVDFEKVVKK